MRRPITAQERQREREEKRRKRQERARERERKMKEKEKKEGRKGECLGGVLLSDNDKSLLERWKRMSDSRTDKYQPSESNGTKISDITIACCHSQSAAGKTIQKSNMEEAEPQPSKQQNELPVFKPSSQLVPAVGQCVPSGMFQLPTTQTALPFALGKPQDTEMGLVAIGGGGGLSVVGAGGLGVVGATCPLPKNNVLKVPSQPSSQFVGTSVFSTLDSWTGTPAGMAAPQQLPQAQPQLPSQQPQQIQQPPQVSPLAPQKNFPQSLPHTQPQAHLQTSVSAFVNNPNPLTHNGTGRVGLATSSTPIPSLDPVPVDKLCPTLHDQPTVLHSQNPSQEPPADLTQTGLSLTDSRPPEGTSGAPDIHTVTLQLSKSQVTPSEVDCFNCLCFLFQFFPFARSCFIHM